MIVHCQLQQTINAYANIYKISPKQKTQIENILSTSDVASNLDLDPTLYHIQTADTSEPFKYFDTNHDCYNVSRVRVIG